MAQEYYKSSQERNGQGKACTDGNKDNVEDMIQSQEDQPGTHRPQRKIAHELGGSQSSVSRLAHKLKLKAYKRIRVSRRDEKVSSK
jgi:DNA-binding MurR/RpiR family transcriptional regulator